MKTYKVTVNDSGTICWFNEKDQLHCEHGPAVIWKDDSVEYYINGKLHREDGPAIISSDGYQFYYINGKLHRENGPALIAPNGYQEYYINGELHREDGPAVINENGFVLYCIKGKELSEEEFKARNTKEVTMEELHKLLGYAVKIKK